MSLTRKINRSVREELLRWWNADTGTWRAWVMHAMLLVVPICIGLLLRMIAQSA